MTDKQLPPDWALAQAFNEAAISGSPNTKWKFMHPWIINRARELSAQQPESAAHQYMKQVVAKDMEKVYKALGRVQPGHSDADCPACSGNPLSCPENEGHGCCNIQQPDAARGGYYPDGSDDPIRPEQPARDGVDFRSWWLRNVPPGTVICSPVWWAARIERFMPATLASAVAFVDNDGNPAWIHDGIGAGVSTRRPPGTQLFAGQPPQPADGEAVPFGHVYRVANRDSLRPWTATGVVFEMGPAPDVEDSFPIQYLNLYLHPPRGIEVTDGYDPNELLRAARHLIGGLMDGGKVRSGDLVLVDRIDQHLAALSGVQR